MTRELNRLTGALLLLFAVVALSVAFWSVLQGESLLARDDNARNVIAEQRIWRGAILDRHGARLAYSEELPSGVMRRVYPQPDAASATGYYSLTYGTAGAEAAVDGVLRGDDARGDWEQLWADALHQPQQGSDVRLTLDLNVQMAAAQALAGKHGAVIALHVPSGDVLAMVSAPGYDPNRLDDQWDRLTRDTTASPLLNRVTAGLYQPGGVLQPVLLAEILGTYAELPQGGATVLSEIVPDMPPVLVNGLTLGCVSEPVRAELTLGEAFALGCPGAFTAAANGRIEPERLWARIENLGLLAEPDLAGFETAAAADVVPLSADTARGELTAELVGQGDLTLTPLHMVQVIGAVANGGQSVPLHLVDATRAPNAPTDAWQPVSVPATNRALLRADVAGGLRLAMLQAAAQNPFVRRASADLRRGDVAVYGHSAEAFAGPEATPYAWFVGFVDMATGKSTDAVAVVVVLKDEPDVGAAADVASLVFAAVSGE